MSKQRSSLICCLYLSTFAVAEWVVMHSTLPSTSTTHPEAFTVNLGWLDEEKDKTTNITLSLKRSEAVGRNIPYFKNDENGKPVFHSLINLKHSAFYNDLKSQASISLTNFGDRNFSLKGSFLVVDEMYEIEPYHPELHKQSVKARKGDHVVKKRSAVSEEVLKEEEKVATALKRLLKGAQKSEIVDRKKRQALPSTTYTVEIYMMVDYYLYEILNKSPQRVKWPGGVDEYIGFFMAHQANEIDAMYRGISSTAWTMGTKLSYLNIANTTSASSWTYPPTDSQNMQVDAITGLDRWTEWVHTTPNLPTADHFMLITGSDLIQSGDSNINGISYIGGICGENKTSLSEVSSSKVYAHQLGHNLGARDDGAGINNCSESDRYIMSPDTAPVTTATLGNPWKFSQCSVDYISAYLDTLDSSNGSCLLNTGEYISSWGNDSSMYLGQIVSVHEQCRIWWGDGYHYARSMFDTVCESLSCTDGSNTETGFTNRMTFQYTSCGNKKWCVNNACVYDEAAPELDEACPFEDYSGTLFSNSNKTCANISGYSCQRSEFVRLYCCKTCQKLATPWLGPNCTYGDRNGLPCNALNSTKECEEYSDLCCQSCCPYLGPDTGYSCVKPTPTTSSTTITATTTPHTTVITPTITSPTATTTPDTTTSITKPSTTTAAVPNASTTITPSTTNNTSDTTTVTVPTDITNTNASTITNTAYVTDATASSGPSNQSDSANADVSSSNKGGTSGNAGAIVGGVVTVLVVAIVIVVVVLFKREQLKRTKLNCCRANDEDSTVSYIGMT